MVKQILKKILMVSGSISSQKLLRNLVIKELSKIQLNPGLSNTRLRRIAANSSFISIETLTREGETKVFQINCPVCGEHLKEVKNKTIWNGTVTLGFRCPICGYWTGKKNRIPSRYIFHYTP